MLISRLPFFYTASMSHGTHYKAAGFRQHLIADQFVKFCLKFLTANIYRGIFKKFMFGKRIIKDVEIQNGPDDTCLVATYYSIEGFSHLSYGHLINLGKNFR